MNLLQMRYVCEIVRERCVISRAAETLGLTQPGLSRQIIDLERELGFNIFVRQRNRLVKLSAFGVEVHRLATQMLLDAEAIKKVAAEFADETAGTLTIATTHTLARYSLPPILKVFVRQFPRVTFRLRQGSPLDAARMVADGTADFSIAAAPLETLADIAFLPCLELPRAILAPMRHPICSERKITLAKLAQYPLITYEFGHMSTSKVMAAFAKAGLEPNIALNAIDADVIKTYVELGMGIAILPAIAYDRTRDKELKQLPASHLFESNMVHIGLRTGDYLRGYMYSFIELFAAHLTRPVLDKALKGEMSST
jgi:LysR family transcriptional regulator, cys regulon transcriptional activator